MADTIQIKALIKPELDSGDLTKSLNKMSKLLSNGKFSDSQKLQLNNLFEAYNETIEKINDKISSGIKTPADNKAIEKLQRDLQQEVKEILKTWEQINTLEIKDIGKIDPNLEKEFKKLQQEIEKSKKDLEDLKNKFLDVSKELSTKNLSTTLGLERGQRVKKDIDKGDIEGAIIEAQKAQEALLAAAEKKNISTGEQNTLLQEAILYEKIGNELKALLPQQQKFNSDQEDLNTRNAEFMARAYEAIGKNLEGATKEFLGTSNSAKTLGNNLLKAASAQKEMNSSFDNLKTKVAYFFSIENAIQLVQRALRNTIQNIKDLDAAMTETAVVTDFSVGDMWDMLPKYTKTAKELGATTQGVYDTLTLFYQQGLDTNEAMSLGIETLKMAGIAGMEYEEATQRMTAALRGFNMELDETSAKRVNDVYSELAAITAADTDQISKAMTKTASIANAANMEFETTAAFLSQIIETTQETAETAGTAMKTVIARFTQVKELISQGQLTGEVEGEEVEINKIDTALKTVGIHLSEFLTGAKGLDDIFLELASKWDTLDLATQRYIATTAAGSRQQSRFLAMMSDYGRTMELVNAANNSAGSANDQFAKKLESLEAKTNRLKDTWQEFSLGLADQGFLKKIIDLSNSILQLINSITKLPGVLGTASKAFLSFITLFAGKKITNVFGTVVFSKIKSFQDGGETAAITFREAFAKEVSGKKLTGLLDKVKIDFNLAKALNFKGINEIPFLKDIKFEDLGNTVDGGRTVLDNIRDTFKLSNNQVQEYKDSLDYLKDSTLAMTLATSKNNEVTFQKIKADAINNLQKNGNTNATEEEIRAEMKEILVEKLGLDTTKKSILVKMKENLIDKLNNTTKKLNNKITLKSAAAKTAEAGSTTLAAAAQNALNAAFWASPIGIIVVLVLALVAAMVALVAITYAVVKAFQQWSDTKKIEKMNEEVERSKAAAEETKKAYDELKEGIDSFKESRKNLDGLTEGTYEWKEALLEVNGQVLALIDKFPELRDAFTFENGVYTLDEDKLTEILERQQQKVIQSQQALAFAEHNRNVGMRKLQTEDMNTPLKRADNLLQNMIKTGTNSQGKEDLTEKLNGQGAIVSNIDKALEKYQKALGLEELPTDLQNVLDKLKSGEGTLEDAKKILQDIQTRVDSEFGTDEQDRYLLAEQLASTMDINPDQKKGVSAMIEKNLEGKETVKERAEELGYEWSKVALGKELGLDLDYGDSEETQQNKIYAKLTNQSVEDVKKLRKDKEWKDDDIEAEIAKLDLARKTTSEVQELLDEVEDQRQKDKERKSKANYEEVFGPMSHDTSGRTVSVGYRKSINGLNNDLEYLEKGFGKEGTLEDNKPQIEISDKMDVLIKSGEFTASELKDALKDPDEMNTLIEAYEKGNKDKGIESHGSIEVAVQMQESAQEMAINSSVIDSTTSAMQVLGEKGVLDQSQYDALASSLSQIKGLYSDMGNAASEWEAISNQSLSVQLDYLTQVQQKAFMNNKYEQQAYLQKVKDLNDLKVLVDSAGMGGELTSDMETLKTSLKLEGNSTDELKKEIESQLQALEGEFKIEIDVVAEADSLIDSTDSLISRMDSLGETVSKVGENYEMTAEDARKLGKVYPELLEGASATSEGMIKLDQSVVDNFSEGEKAKLKASIEEQKAQINIKIKELIRRKKFLLKELGYVQAAIESEEGMDKALALKAIENQGSIADGAKIQAENELISQKEKIDKQATNEEVLTEQLTEEEKTQVENAKKGFETIVTNSGYMAGGIIEAIKKIPEKVKKAIGNISVALSNGFSLSNLWTGLQNAWSTLTTDVTVSMDSVEGNWVDSKEFDEDKLATTIDPVYKELNGKKGIDLNATLQSYFDKTFARFKETDGLINELEGQKVLLDAAYENFGKNIDEMGTDKDKKGKSDKKKWEYKYKVDDNMKRKVDAAEKELSLAKAKQTNLLNDENSTTEDILANKKEQLEILDEQMSLQDQLLEVQRKGYEDLLKEHPEWEGLFEIDENGTFLRNEEAIKNLNLSSEEGSELENWLKELERLNIGFQQIQEKREKIVTDIQNLTKTVENEFGKVKKNQEDLKRLAEKRELLKWDQELFTKLGSVQGASLSDQRYLNNIKQSGSLTEETKKIAEIDAYNEYENVPDRFKQYFDYDRKNNFVNIDTKQWEKLAEAGDQELYNQAKEYLNKVQEKVEVVNQLQKESIDLQKEQIEAYEELGDNDNALLREIFNKVLEVLRSNIEAMTTNLETVKKSDEEVLKSIKDSLDQERQERENKEKEEELSNLQSKIDYLSMDTSGANSLEILQLQKQLEDQSENYTDTLIDQKINELEDQNNEAYLQREREIAILKAQLDEALESGDLLNLATQLKKHLVGENGSLDTSILPKNLNTALSSKENGLGNLIYNSLGGTNGFPSVTASLKTFRELFGFTDSKELKVQSPWENFKKDEELKELISSATTLNSTFSKEGELIKYIKVLYSEALQRRKQYFADDARRAERIGEGLEKATDIDFVYLDVNHDDKIDDVDAQLILRKSVGLDAGKAYATGGLADYTGPAWLDGTKSHPELVLNQKDTQNFIQLKDILGNLLAQQPNGLPQNNGDNYFEIHLNVDKITSDYDVEQLTEKIKTIIVEDASYRGVNSIYRR